MNLTAHDGGRKQGKASVLRKGRLYCVHSEGSGCCEIKACGSSGLVYACLIGRVSMLFRAVSAGLVTDPTGAGISVKAELTGGGAGA